MAGRPLPLAVLMMISEAWSGHEFMSDERKAFYEYHQLFAQVTNPPLNGIREELVAQIEIPLGPEGERTRPATTPMPTAILAAARLNKSLQGALG